MALTAIGSTGATSVLPSFFAIMPAWLCAIIVWPPSTSCGPRSSVPPVTRRTEVQPSFELLRQLGVGEQFHVDDVR